MASSAPRIGFVSLGCPKALVDSERILTQRMEFRPSGIAMAAGESVYTISALTLAALGWGGMSIVVVTPPAAAEALLSAKSGRVAKPASQKWE